MEKNVFECWVFSMILHGKECSAYCHRVLLPGSAMTPARTQLDASETCMAPGIAAADVREPCMAQAITAAQLQNEVVIGLEACADTMLESLPSQDTLLDPPSSDESCIVASD